MLFDEPGSYIEICVRIMEWPHIFSVNSALALSLSIDLIFSLLRVIEIREGNSGDEDYYSILNFFSKRTQSL